MINDGLNFIIFTDFPTTNVSITNSFPASDAILDPWANRTSVNWSTKIFWKRLPKIVKEEVDFYVYQIINTPFGAGGHRTETVTDTFQTIIHVASIRRLTTRLDQSSMIDKLASVTSDAGHTPNIAMIDFANTQNILPTCMKINGFDVS